MMTFDETVAEHRKMWNWIADETLRLKRVVNKSEYFFSIGLRRNDWPVCKCFCCEYTSMCCDHCPLEWHGSDKTISQTCFIGGEYSRWRLACEVGDWEKASDLARQIANLPEREIEREEAIGLSESVCAETTEGETDWEDLSRNP